MVSPAPRSEAPRATMQIRATQDGVELTLTIIGTRKTKGRVLLDPGHAKDLSPQLLAAARAVEKLAAEIVVTPGSQSAV